MARFFGGFSDARIMVKMCAIVMVPVIGLTVVSTLEAIEKEKLASEMDRTSRLVDLAADISKFAASLQREAAASSAFVTSGKQGSVPLADLQRASLAAAAQVSERSKALDLPSVSAELNEVVVDGLAKAAGIDAMRPQISSGSVVAVQMNGTFTGAIVRLLDFSTFAPKAIGDMEVARSMHLYGDVLQATEASSAARANAVAGFGAGRFDLRTFLVVSSFLTRQTALQESIHRVATPAQRAFFAQTYAGPPVQETNRMVAVMMGAGPGGDVSAVTPDAWLKVNSDRMDLYRLVQKRFEDDLRAAAATVKTKAERDLWFQVGLSLALLGATGVIAFLIARGITRPIRGLVESMGSLAKGDIEREVPFTARRDELGDMARSVAVFKDNAVRAQALEAQAAEARLAADDERARRETERAATTEQQARVVADLAAGLAGLAAGDLTGRVRAFPDEYRKLEGDFNAAIETLQATIQAIAGNGQGIRSGSGEISQAADDLSRRTEQQAASLEETAAALDEITATVRKTAEGAKHASQVVESARGDAERSGKVVQDAVVAMGAIEKSAQEISQIIGVIDEIAFQTNLLALNAGVEAARAGEAGKGFAVVASEVRALAQRSAQAAKEIKALISTSTSQVANGVMLVGETGKTLARIAGQVTEITGIVSEIAASAQEQAVGLAQVNTAVNQMDQMTQQNSAMVEESTAASHSLAGEAEQLATLIGRFRTGDEGACAPAPRPAARAAAPVKPAVRSGARPPARPVSGPATHGNLALKPQPAEDEWEEF